MPKPSKAVKNNNRKKSVYNASKLHYFNKPMSKKESRRINPIARVTFVVVALVVVFEILVIGGVLELKAQTVAKYAPWAYEPFLKLVGEHPESSARWATVEEADESDDDILPEGAPYLPGTNDATTVTNALPEVEPVYEVTPTNAPPVDPEEFVPVG